MQSEKCNSPMSYWGALMNLLTTLYFAACRANSPREESEFVALCRMTVGGALEDFRRHVLPPGDDTDTKEVH